MNKLIVILTITLALASSSMAQLTNIEKSGVLKSTNYSVDPYLTYAPKAPQKVGGGVLAVYNVNQYVGTAIGIDYLGNFNMISADATLKKDIYVQKYTPFLDFATNLVITPFVLTGAGTPISDTGTPSAIVIIDSGAYFRFGHLWKGEFNAGACYGAWENAGAYSGPRYHIFLGWSKGF